MPRRPCKLRIPRTLLSTNLYISFEIQNVLSHISLDPQWAICEPKQVDFQRAKRMSYLVDAVEDGVVDIDSLDADEIDILAEELERRQQSVKKSLAERKRKASFLSAPNRRSLDGTAVFIEPDVQIGEARLREFQRRDKWRKVGYGISCCLHDDGGYWPPVLGVICLGQTPGSTRRLGNHVLVGSKFGSYISFR